MTDLNKRISRRSTAIRGRRRIVVLLDPDNRIGFRLERCRGILWADIDDLFRVVQNRAILTGGKRKSKRSAR